MMQSPQTAYNFKDIMLVPQLSEITSRNMIDLSTEFLGTKFKLPLINSPMRTIVGSEMVKLFTDEQLMSITHRFQTVDEQLNHMKHQRFKVCSVGISETWKNDICNVFSSCADAINIDVAHGGNSKVADFVSWLKKAYPNIKIIAGNVVTPDAALTLVNPGADAVRVGVGNGSACTTTNASGHGYPQFSAIDDIAIAREQSSIKFGIIADGGMTDSGDIAKALAAGADMAMVGSMLSGTKETPGNVLLIDGIRKKQYDGSASFETKMATLSPVRNIEGLATIVHYKGEAYRVLGQINDGLNSALSYSGAQNLNEFRDKVEWVIIA